MLTFLRWTGRVLFALLILVLLAGIWISWIFQQWKTEKLAALDAGSRIVATSAGDIEYTEHGSGSAVLVCHGAPGGYDQAALIGGFLANDGFRVIAPSRPGFLRTPLTSGLLFEDQADAFAALLDKLGIKSVSVIGFATGTPVAVQFALRHPDRTKALVLISPILSFYSPEMDVSGHDLLAHEALFGLTGDMGAWMFVKQSARNPRPMLEKVLALDTTQTGPNLAKLVDFVLGNPAQLAFFRELAGTQAPLSPRETGTRNDLIQLRAFAPISYEKIQAPILLVQGTAIHAASWTSLKPLTDKLPGARFLRVHDTGELVWFGPDADQMLHAVTDFLHHPPPAPTPTPTPLPTPASPPPTN